MFAKNPSTAFVHDTFSGGSRKITNTVCFKAGRGARYHSSATDHVRVKIDNVDTEAVYGFFGVSRGKMFVMIVCPECRAYKRIFQILLKNLLSIKPTRAEGTFKDAD